MADKKISQLDEVFAPVSGAYTVIVSGGTTQKITIDNLYAKAFTTVKNIDSPEAISTPAASEPISLVKEHTVLSAASSSTYGIAASTHGNKKTVVATTTGPHTVTVQSAAKAGEAVGAKTFVLGQNAIAKLENVGGVWYLVSGTWS